MRRTSFHLLKNFFVGNERWSFAFKTTQHNHLTDSQLRTKMANRLEVDFSKLKNNTQRELICAAQMYIFVHKVKQSTILNKDEKKRITPLVSERISRVSNDVDSGVFIAGLYPNSSGTFEDHLGSGGDSSAFRGTTETQDQEILEETKNSQKLLFIPITYEAIDCIALKESLKMHEYTELTTELGFRSQPEIYGAEAELAVPRAIPGRNIKTIINPQKDSQLLIKLR